ncbi:MAG TPA: zinc-dependent metalloprotease family protein [Pyrinomonadaceae bacterium]|jgi:hypothetical protein
MFRRFFQSLFLFIIVVFSVSTALSQSLNDDVWQESEAASLQFTASARTVTPKAYRTFSLNKTNLFSILNKAPMAFNGGAPASEVILTLPMPDGSFQRFRIEKSPVAEAGLLEKFPELGETYRGQGVDDPTATARFDFLPSGFHSMILSRFGTVLVDPYFAKGDTQNYISYRKADAPQSENFVCNVKDRKRLSEILSPEGLLSSGILPDSSENVMSGTQLRTYRLALAATNEYAVAVGSNTLAGTLAAQVLIMNRVNAVYERDLAIHMNIVANNNLLIFSADNIICGGVACTAANDGYTNNDGDAMLDENQAKVDAVVGTANYDIGHVFSTGGGGVAFLGIICQGGFKAGGVTGLTNPTGDAFAIDYVAHEMGHQFGADHTFNGTVTNCGGGNRAASEAYETGSGITIMGYAGICGNQDLAIHSIDTFHVKSIERIIAYTQTGAGNSCSMTTASGNTPPAVSTVGGTSFNIPKQTPFALTASATDANNDSLTFDWQEYDLGNSTTAVPNTDATGGARPIFRPYPPTASGTRVFPALQYILNNANVPPASYNCGRTANCLTGELLPSIGRTMTFQVIARDNHTSAGGINTATATVVVDANSGPFAITSPNTNVSVAGGASQTVAWNVANTTGAPVNAANVKISLSTDGGQTFPTVLAASTPNDGSQAVTIPNTATTQARIKIEAVGNIFFDISDANFSITSSTPCLRGFVDFDGDCKTDISIYRPSAGEWWYTRSSDNGIRVGQFGTSSDVIVPADFTGDGKTDIAFWRPSTGFWFILRSEDNSFYSVPFGASGDIPAPGDFDGDGRADVTVYRPSTGTWFISLSSGGTRIQQFGIAEDKPVVGDYDDDGLSDIAIFRPSVAQWWLLRSGAGLIATQFGTVGDKAVPADYTGDGIPDIAVWRPSTGFWYILRSENASFYSVPFGTTGDVPAPGDYDGDGKSDTAVFRPSSNTWFVQRSTAGTLITGFGTSGDAAVPNAYVR